MNLLQVALFSCVLMATSSCANAPEEGECEKLLAHLIELENGASKASESAAAEREQRVVASIGDNFIARCNRDLPGEQVRCALKAESKEAVAKCDQ